jgi:hypothetical protein
MRTVFRNSEIPGRIHALQPFLSVGKLPDGTRIWSGHSGPAISFGHLPSRYHVRARGAVYVVYSYDTPIAWATEREDSGRDRGHPYLFEVPDIGYSPTTGQHQYAVLEAWADELRRQGAYRRWPASHRETVQVPANAEVYGRAIRARSGGMDGVRPGEAVGRTGPSPDDLEELEYGPGYAQGPPVRGWSHHPAHP